MGRVDTASQLREPIRERYLVLREGSGVASGGRGGMESMVRPER